MASFAGSFGAASKTSDFARRARQKPIHYPPFITVSASPQSGPPAK